MYTQPSAPLSQDQRASLGTTCTRPSGLLKIFVTPGCYYSFFKLYFSLYLLKRHFLHFCCKDIYASQPLFANVIVFLLQAAIMFATYYNLFTCQHDTPFYTISKSRSQTFSIGLYSISNRFKVSTFFTLYLISFTDRF